MNRWSRRMLSGMLAFACLASAGPGTAQESPPAATPAAPAAGELPAAPLSLAEVLKSSLEKNLDLIITRFDPKIAETRITVAEAAFDPQIFGSAQVGEDNSPQADRLSGEFVTASKDKTFAASYVDPLRIGSTFQFDVFTNRHLPGDPGPTYFSQALATYTQPFLRNFGKKVNETQITIARNNRDMSRSRFRQVVMDTLSTSEKAYWDLNFAIMNLKTTEASLKLAQDFLGQTEIKVKVGTLPPIEITQAQAGVADREEAVILAKNAILTAEDNLRQLMNIQPDSPLWKQSIQPTDQPQVLDKVIDMDEAIQTALRQRPDLEQARLDLANREADLVFRRNQKLYRLDLIARYGASGLAGNFFVRDPVTGAILLDSGGRPLIASTGVGQTFSDIAQRDSNTWSAELQLGIPIRNRAAEAAYAASHYEEERSKVTIEQLEQGARVEARNAVRQIETNLKRVKAAQVNTKLQREKLDAEQKKYANGMSTTFQILQFQTDLTTAESRENQAIVDYNKSLVELDRVLGILLDTRNITIAE